MKNAINTMKKRKGFSLVELVVVILIIAILAVAVFAGGSAAIKKAQISRTTSDLHNFSIAIESAMNETPSVANAETKAGTEDTSDLYKAIKANLPADYQLTGTIALGASDTVTGSAEITKNTGNLRFEMPTNNETTKEIYTIFESAKTDAWGNHYYVILDAGERHQAGQSDYFVTVVSAGPNAQTIVGGNIESDDIFLLVQYSDGDVSAVTYNVADTNAGIKTPTGEYTVDAKAYTPLSGATNFTTKGAAGTIPALYAGGENNTDGRGLVLPVNF